MKRWQKGILVLLAAVTLELIWFNFEPLLLRLRTDAQTDVVARLVDMTPVNYTKEPSGAYRSEADPQLFVTAPPTDVQTVEMFFETVPQQTECVIFYQDSLGVLQSITATADVNGWMKTKLHVNGGTLLRIDVGDNEGILLTDAEIVYNSTEIHFSIARVITMLLVWYGASFLFSLQKMPDYKKYM